MASSSQKRPFSESDSTKPSKRGHWSQGLLQSVNDPSLVIEKDEKIVIIKDKYPKAKYHFLILPHEKIPNLKSLKPHHAPLLKHMDASAKKLTETYPGFEFRFGYHAIPSMSQIHLHMISQDFDSPCLKTKRHWNSFNTKYFINSEEIIKCLSEGGRIITMTPVSGKELLEQSLKCHKCNYAPQNMPKLKLHITTHLKK